MARIEIFKDHTERKSGHYSWLYYNNHLRRCILSLMKVKKVSYRVLAKETRTPLSKLNLYVNMNPDVKGLSDLQIIKVATYLGLDFSLKIDYNVK